jgi:hypothetical protein
MMGLASIRRERAVRSNGDNGDPGSLFLGQGFRQAVKGAVKEALREAILEMIPGVRAARWVKNAVKKLANKLKVRWIYER